MIYKNLALVLAVLSAFTLTPAHAARNGADTLIVGKQGSTANKVIKMGSGQVIWSQADSKLKFSNDAGGTLKDIGSGGSGQGINLGADLNFDFEAGSPPSGWTASGGSFTAATSSPNLLVGGKSGVFNASGASQTLTSGAVTVTTSAAIGLNGGNGYASCFFKTAAVDYKLQVWDGSVVLSERVIPALASAQEIGTYFIIPSSGTIALRISSQSDAADLAIDNCFMGSANVISVSQAKLATSVKFEDANCESWVRNSATIGAFTADTDCGPPQVVEAGFLSVSSTDTDLPKVTLLNAPAGTYIVRVTASVVPAIAQEIRLAVNDGTNSRGVINAYLPNTSNTTSVAVEAPFSYSLAGDRTFEIFGSTPGGGNLTLRGGLTSSTGPLNITISYYPPAQEQALRMDQVGWHVNANIAGADITLSGSNQSAYVEMTDAGLTLTNNATQGSIAAQIACSSGNPSTGTTCAAGSESNGIAFVAPSAVVAKACASFGHLVGVTAGTVDAAFQIVKTTNTSSAVVLEANGRMPSRVGGTMTNTNPIELCGLVQLDAGLNTLRVEYEQDISGTVGTNVVRGSALASTGQADIHWTVFPVNTPQPSPLLVGSVTSSSSGLERVERARVTCGSAGSAIVTQSGSWISSITNGGGAGNCTVNIAASQFSGEPACSCTTIGVGSGSASHCMFTATPTSSALAILRARAGANENGDINILCQGPR